MSPTPTPSQLLHAFLDTTVNSIIPLTAKGVASGCKVFGAAILDKETLKPIQVATNDETVSPLLHGEINCIQQFYSLPSDQRPLAKDTIFFATHEPCSLCLSGITWGGFDNHYYLFTYEETRDTFAIPYDIDILEQVFRVPSLSSSETPTDLTSRPLYNKSNKFWTALSVNDLVASLVEGEEKDQLEKRVKEVKKMYDGLSETYQNGKGEKGIPLA
ncbi:cytidine deaminase-like protein [Leucosporidium creatinivorum]|uniref:Cytidine deaminase-like protein n=1 Tax=Leucosporidium creatinivorum TaxID=106004 RepID=A0A1Y2G8G9_9BASI|nr:cytidine deaminase-like protein [Leucosporidium creatinivorum]